MSGARDRLRQVFANLLDNAIKYTPEGGQVRVGVTRDEDTAVVAVSDTGAGIAAEHLPRIWERLYRADPSRSERGLGLGLSLVKAYVTAHGGTVEADSQPGRGSTFTVRLPTLAPFTVVILPLPFSKVGHRLRNRGDFQPCLTDISERPASPRSQPES